MSGTLSFPRHGARGFTLLELMIVVGIIALLLALVFPALSAARQRRLILAAQIEVKLIAAAAQQYYQALQCYPPDTDQYGTGDTQETVTERGAVYKYLCQPVIEQATNVPYGPFMQAKVQWLKQEAGEYLYCDPWGQPFHMDCLHTEVDKQTGDVLRIGEPFPAGTEDRKKTMEVKVWSAGPDIRWSNGSSTEFGRGPDIEDADNPCSWLE